MYSTSLAGTTCTQCHSSIERFNLLYPHVYKFIAVIIKYYSQHFVIAKHCHNIYYGFRTKMLNMKIPAKFIQHSNLLCTRSTYVKSSCHLNVIIVIDEESYYQVGEYRS